MPKPSLKLIGILLWLFGAVLVLVGWQFAAHEGVAPDKKTKITLVGIFLVLFGMLILVIGGFLVRRKKKGSR